MTYSKSNIVLVDMDDVLADFEGFVYHNLRAHHPEIDLTKPRLHHYIYQDFAPEYHDIINAVSDHPDFFASLPVVSGALDGWQKLLDLGYDPVICTSPKLSNTGCIEGKKAWITQHMVTLFGSSVLNRAHITKDKYQIEALALIDDKAEIAHADSASWTHILFNTSYNQHVDNPFRLRGWNDPALVSMIENLRR